MASRVLAGRYELIEKIGEGGMAVVFRAKDRLLNRNVAIKILRPEYTKDSMFIESFRRESQIAAGLVHPNIVNIYDVGKQGNIYYIVMELIEGQPLSNIIKEKGPLDPRWAVSIAKQVASALSLAHSSQLIHRDVKPHNIMITKDGTAKITDFGIAKAVSTDTFVGDQKKSIMGSVHYFSPEQARGGYVDERSDIYSLGICLYEMLTGKVPFDGETAVEVAVKHMNEDMVPPTELNPGIPQDIEDIIMKASSKLQTNRYRSAEEMITALNFVKFSRHSESSGVSKESVLGARAAAEAAEPGDAAEEPETENPQEQPDAEDIPPAEEEKKDHSKALQRIAAVVLAVALAFPASIAAAKFVNNIKEAGSELMTSNKEVEVPDLQGWDFDDAKDALEDMGLEIEIQMSLTSKLFKENEIMSQTPSKESMVKQGTVIKVSVSKGEAVIEVPDLRGKNLSAARYSLESSGYTVGEVEKTFSEDVPAGLVMSQDPGWGVKLASGKAVNLVISKGSEEDNTLDLIGMSRDEALSAIEAKGFKIGEITEVNDPSVEKDHVISQDPQAGTVIEDETTAVSLVISLGPEMDGEPADNTDPNSGITWTLAPEGGSEGSGEGSESTQTGSGESGAPASGVAYITIELGTAPAEEFTLMVTTSDVDGTRTASEKLSKLLGKKVITVSGKGSDATVVVRFDNDIAGSYSVNFETGAVVKN